MRPSEALKEFKMIVEESNIRLDKYVSERVSYLTRSQVEKLIKDGNITVNGKISHSGLKVTIGDLIDVIIPPPPPIPVTPEDIPMKIIYEDADLLVVDKSPGLTVHPAPGHPGGTLVNAILHYYPHLAEIGDSPRPGVVHRLDRDTSGVMLVAKKSAAQTDLSEQFQNRTVHKTYITLVKGHLTPKTGIIEAPMGRHPHDRKRMAVVSRGRDARTEYRVLEYVGDYSLLEIRPETGRTHQIRVHMAAIGYPVVGDATYGVKSPYISRQFLHAHKIRFRLPSTGEYAEFQSELAPDLKRALEEIGRT
jgi:23S rRNA pseudouridine1911/1915/1917 synthase